MHAEWFTPYQSKDLSPIIPTNLKKEEERKTVEDQKGTSRLG